MNYEDIIQYKTIGNTLKIEGTNQFKDFLISAQCWPKKRYHSGCYKVAKWLLSKVSLDKSSPVIIEGHSMGGSIAEVLAGLLADEGYAVIAISKGSYPVCLFNRTLSGDAIIYGNDPVPALFPWFRHIVRKRYIGPKRWLPVICSDHVRY